MLSKSHEYAREKGNFIGKNHLKLLSSPCGSFTIQLKEKSFPEIWESTRILAQKIQ